jgi:hypothetical protein
MLSYATMLLQASTFLGGQMTMADTVATRTTTPIGGPAVPQLDARRWPAPLAIVTAWLAPATTTVRMLHVGFLAAFAVHVTGLIAFAVLASMDRRTGRSSNKAPQDGAPSE